MGRCRPGSWDLDVPIAGVIVHTFGQRIDSVPTVPLPGGAPGSTASSTAMMAAPVNTLLRWVMPSSPVTWVLAPLVWAVSADLEPMTDPDHRCENAVRSVLAGLVAARLAACPDVGSIGMVQAPILRVAGSH